MMLCIINSILNNNGLYNPQSVLKEYVRWLRSKPFDYGETIGGSFCEYDMKQHIDLSDHFKMVKQKNFSSKANGALMRAPALALILSKLSKDEAVEVAHKDTLLSHPSESCKDASGAYILALRPLILNENDVEGAYKAAESYFSAKKPSEVLSWLDDAKKI